MLIANWSTMLISHIYSARNNEIRYSRKFVIYTLNLSERWEERCRTTLHLGIFFAEGVLFSSIAAQNELAVNKSIHGVVVEHLKIMQFNTSLWATHNSDNRAMSVRN
jgi:hypothetical protein